VTLIEPNWPTPPGVRALVTTRAGGVSRRAYASLNLAEHVGDNPGCVADNRRRLQRLGKLPAPPQWLQQVHGARVISLGSPPDGPADGAVTCEPGQVCAVLTADCLPVLLARMDGSAVGIAHAGWRGLAAGVLANAVAALGGSGAALLAWLGPGISAAAYEVGADVHSALLAANAGYASALTPNTTGRWQADLALVARLALQGLGVRAIYGGGYCTFTDKRFFSHRRQAPCGRFASLIWLEQ